VDQIREGAHPEQVADALALHRTTVYGWCAQFRAGGREALLAKPIPGRPPKLDEDQQRQAFEWVTGSDPRQLAFDFALWTR
jgi:transposase